MISTHICTCVLFVLMCGTNVAAFTATLTTGTHTFTPVVKYTQILSANPIGYDPITGKFTAGENGTYLVSVTMMTGTVVGHANIMTTASLPVPYVWLFTGANYDMATQTVCVELTVGQEVWVQMAPGPILFDVYNTFTVVKVLG